MPALDAANESATQQTLARVWRAESGTIVGALARLVRDVGVAEELAQDALVAALEHWPQHGVPDVPGAWLMATAKNRALDRLRREVRLAQNLEQIGADLQAQQALLVPDFADALDARRADEIGDDLLRLIFTACHPVLGTDARTALTLKLLGGLSTAEIARAYLLPEATIAQRIVRAKRSLSAAQVAFELPRGAAAGERLASVLEVIYLIFNEGYTATAGDDWMRPALCGEALRLGQMLTERVPHDAEVQGLYALMALQASRLAARTDAAGRPVLLADQDRSRWDPVLIEQGLQALERAQRSAGAPAGPGGAAETAASARSTKPVPPVPPLLPLLPVPPVPQRAPAARSAPLPRERAPARYRLQACIAACHARAASTASTDWAAIAALYGELARAAPSPVVELNRAVAVGMAYGPAAGLALVDAIADEPALRHYHWLPSVRADLLARLGRRPEARAEFERAAALAQNQRERALLLERARDMDESP